MDEDINVENNKIININNTDNIENDNHNNNNHNDNDSDKIINKKCLFCYGSNSVEQIKDRLNINRKISYSAAYIDNYTRIFCGISKKWDNSGIASIYPMSGNKVYGIIVYLTEEEINKLDEHEGGYTRTQIEGRIQNLTTRKTKKELFEVYIKNNHNFRRMPSENYMKAILKMIKCRDNLREKTFEMNDTDKIDIHSYKRILIKAYVNNAILKIGYWTENEGFHIYDNIF